MMSYSELERLGRDAAEQAAGVDAVGRVEVSETADDNDRPEYLFSFMIDQDLARQRPGLVYIRIIQSLLDALESRGDEHQVWIRILSPSEWDLRSGA
jgi:hypothetical protein